MRYALANITIGLYVLFSITDIATTIAALSSTKNDFIFSESNPILGPNPSILELTIHSVALGILVYVICVFTWSKRRALYAYQTDSEKAHQLALSLKFRDLYASTIFALFCVCTTSWFARAAASVNNIVIALDPTLGRKLMLGTGYPTALFYAPALFIAIITISLYIVRSAYILETRRYRDELPYKIFTGKIQSISIGVGLGYVIFLTVGILINLYS